MISRVYGILPVWTIFTEKFLPQGRAGQCYGIFNVIKPASRGDKGIIEHELVHSRQWYRGLGVFHWLRYKYSWAYRYRAELQAYAVQLTHYDEFSVSRMMLFAKYISETYDLPIKYDLAFSDLMIEYERISDD